MEQVILPGIGAAPPSLYPSAPGRVIFMQKFGRFLI